MTPIDILIADLNTILLNLRVSSDLLAIDQVLSGRRVIPVHLANPDIVLPRNTSTRAQDGQKRQEETHKAKTHCGKSPR